MVGVNSLKTQFKHRLIFIRNDTRFTYDISSFCLQLHFCCRCPYTLWNSATRKFDSTLPSHLLLVRKKDSIFLYYCFYFQQNGTSSNHITYTFHLITSLLTNTSEPRFSVGSTSIQKSGVGERKVLQLRRSLSETDTATSRWELGSVAQVRSATRTTNADHCSPYTGHWAIVAQSGVSFDVHLLTLYVTVRVTSTWNTASASLPW